MGRYGKQGLTFHNYIANFGNTDHVGASIGGLNPIKYLSSPFVGQDDGSLGPNHTLYSKFGQITDGLSKTMMVSETVQGQNGDLRGLTWWGWSSGFESYGTPNGSDPDRMQQAAVLPADGSESALCNRGGAAF